MLPRSAILPVFVLSGLGFIAFKGDSRENPSQASANLQSGDQRMGSSRFRSEIGCFRRYRHRSGGETILTDRREGVVGYRTGTGIALRAGSSIGSRVGFVPVARSHTPRAPVFGTFQIQKPGGQGIIASGTNHKGDTDWVKETLYFEAPADGRVRVAVFFVGFGKGTGTAWFDDLKLEEVDPSTIPLKVTRDLLFKETISPNQYGQFIEYLCDLVPSMWAEKLSDGSFEGLTPYKVAYIKETDFREHPWYPVGATNRANFTLDKGNPVSGLVAGKIATKGETPCTVGIAQDGIAVDSEQPCVFSCYLKQEGITGPGDREPLQR